MIRCALLPLLLLFAACGNSDTEPEEDRAESPPGFRVKFATTEGDIVVQARPDWAPHGAARFRELVEKDYFENVAFFRVVPGFVAQFGVHGDPAKTARWLNATIPDDRPKVSNTRGRLTFAATGRPNSRSMQLFFNLANNSRLDGMGFAPIGEIVEGMEVLDRLHGGYGDGPPQGRGPNQGRFIQEGNPYLQKSFPNLDYIESATIIE